MSRFRHKYYPSWCRNVKNEKKGINKDTGLIEVIEPRVEIQFGNGFFTTEDAFLIKFVKSLPEFQRGDIVDADLEDKLLRRKVELDKLVATLVAIEDEKVYEKVIASMKRIISGEKENK